MLQILMENCPGYIAYCRNNNYAYLDVVVSGKAEYYKEAYDLHYEKGDVISYVF